MKRILLLVIPAAFATAGHSQITTLNSGATITAIGGVDSAEFFLQKGLTEKQNGRRLESLKYFEKAATYDANSRAIVTELAQVYLDLRRYGLARESFKKLVTLGDESAATYKQLMMLSYQLKQSDDVILYADKLSKIDPSEKIAFYVGKVHYDNDNYGDAIRFLTKATTEDPTNAEAPYLIARSYADMSNYKQCIPFFLKAIELNPAQPYWVYELGLIYYAMNDDKNALKYILEAGDKGYKRDNDYLENLAIAYLNVGELDKGVLMLQEILKRRPSDMNILSMVAEAYYGKGKFDQSMEYYDRMLEFDKQNASALYMIGMCYQKKGGKVNTEKGIRLCDTAIQMDPSLSNLKQKKMMMGM